MQKENLIRLIEKIKRTGEKRIEELLKKDEKILEALLTLDDNIFVDGVSIALSNYKNNVDILRAIDILKKALPSKFEYVALMLMNNKLIDRNIALDCAKLFNNIGCNFKFAKEYLFHPNTQSRSNETILKDLEDILDCTTSMGAVYLCGLLKNQENYPKDIVVEGTKILQTSIHPKRMHNIYKVLINEKSIQYKVAVEGAKKIDEVKSDFVADCAEYILKEEVILKTGIALEAVDIINNFKNNYDIESAMNIVDNEDILKGGVMLESLKLIEQRNYEHQKPWLYDVLTNKKLIEQGLSIEVGKLIVSLKKESDIRYTQYISGFACAETVDPSIIIDGCKLIIDIKNEEQKKLIVRVLTNKYLNKTGNALMCAKQILDIKNKNKVSFIVNTVLSNEEFACDKFISEIIEEIKNSDKSFTSFHIKPNTKYAKIVELGLMFLNNNNKVCVYELNILLHAMKNLTEEEIILIKHKYQERLFIKELNKLLNNPNTDLTHLIVFLQKSTNTKGFDIVEEKEVLVVLEPSVIENEKSGAEILLEMIKEEPSEDIKTDTLVKKLVKRRKNNTKGNTTE